jgi:iron(III) transport system permease protein
VRRSFAQKRFLFSLIPVLALGLLVGYPLLRLLGESFLYDGRISLENYRQIAVQPANFIALWRTLTVGVAVTILATAIGTFLAWLVARTDLPGKERFKPWILLPYLIPSFIGAFAWTQLLGPVGYINKLYQALTGSQVPLANIYGLGGIILVLMGESFPLVYLTSVGAFARIDSALEEAARVAGADRWRVLRDITLPVLTPTLLNGALLVFVITIANFGVPAALGFSQGFYVLTTKIYDSINNASLHNHLALASALSVVLGLLAGAGLLGANLVLRGKNYATLTGKGQAACTVSLGRWGRPLAFVITLFILFFSLLPVLAILLTSFIRAYGLEPSLSNMTLAHYRYVFLGMPVAQRALRNSAFLALTAAALTTLAGGIIAYAASKGGLWYRSCVEVLANLPNAVPGTVVALAMILTYSQPLPLTGWQLYNTLWIILLAYVIRYLIFPVRSTAATLSQVAGSLEEAARLCGARRWQAVRDIVLPLSWPGLTAGWFLVLIPTLHELTVSVLLWSVGNETLGVAVFNLQESGSIPATAALAAVTIGLVLIVYFLFRRVVKLDSGF